MYKHQTNEAVPLYELMYERIMNVNASEDINDTN